MGQTYPLGRFPLSATNSAEEAEAILTRSLTDASILRVTDRKHFQFHMNGVRFGRTALYFNRYESGCTVRAGEHDSLFLNVAGRRSFCFTSAAGTFIASPRKAVALMPGQGMKIERPSGSEILVLTVKPSDLVDCFEEQTGRRHRGPLLFDQSIDLAGSYGGLFKRQIRFLLSELEHDDKIVQSPLFRKSCDQMIMTTLLFLSPPLRERLEEAPPYTVPGPVSRAEEYMRAHLEDHVTIADLLEACDCSRGMLFSAFRSARGFTPLEFLNEQRLQSARTQLTNPLPGDSVSSVAMKYGFNSFGRFAQVYRKRFGELPSETLRKGRMKI